MDLHIKITDEHGNQVTDEHGNPAGYVNVYQDGSDIEGAAAIISHIKATFDTDEDEHDDGQDDGQPSEHDEWMDYDPDC